MQNALADSDRGGTVELTEKKVILTAGVAPTPQGTSSGERQQTG